MASRLLTVLIVDDSEIARETTRFALEEAGYTAIAVESPLGMSNRIATAAPHVVLVDVEMPALRGDAAVDVLRKRGVTCPILLYSSRPASELAPLAVACGASGYVVKNADFAELLEVVGRAATAPQRATTGRNTARSTGRYAATRKSG